MKSFSALLVMAAALLQVSTAGADYPTKTIRMVVPFAAGGTVDALARIVSEGLSRELGRPVIVENRAGAGGNIGAEAVMRARADGHTLLFGFTPMVQIPHMFEKPPFDAEQDFTAIAQLVTGVGLMVVNADSGIENIEQLVELVRSEPGKHSYGSFGIGSSAHLYGLALAEKNNLDMAHIAYRGESPSITDLLAGQVTAVIAGISGNTMPHIRAGKLVPVAVTGPRRSPVLPDVPTFKELGYVDIDTRGWIGILGPKGMDIAVRDRVAEAALKVVQEPDVRQRIDNIMMIMDPLGPEEFGAIISNDNRMWREIIKKANISVEG
ncbi:Bug family tripartite tricarboxylate transporter substrate binding protein [Isoalcanivorax beigongshangi]|uniref:Bug family tripartite tricarboxylate transporter substrate binding protein n=1 Tax=Isoalcanivorax beigongshangi TaxID=3238810 RepID=A0ABV4AKN9_9GAMM